MKEKENKEEKYMLYKILDLTQEATEADIKRQYWIMAMKFHPDKNKEEKSKEIFQKINQAYEILSDKDKKAIYDMSGYLDEGFGLDNQSFVDSYKVFWSVFKKVTVQDILNYEQKYRNSKEEQEDLISFLVKSQGNIKKILLNIPLSRNEDIERYIKFYEKIIVKKEYKKYKETFDKTKIKIIKLKEIKKKIDAQSLQQKIVLKQREDKSDMFLEQLEKKYTKIKK